jgi:soluble lytic murein transglycosylase-like protein
MEILILTIALEVGVPPYFVLAIAETENPLLNPYAVHLNANGTLDRGIMQLNSSWYDGDWSDPRENIRAGCEHIKWLIAACQSNLWFAAVAYNCGYTRMRTGPPAESIKYAERVFEKWNMYRESYFKEEIWMSPNNEFLRNYENSTTK